MSNNDLTTRSMKISDVKNQFSSLVNEVSRNHTRVIVEKHGVPVAAIVSTGDLQRLSQLDRGREELFKVVDRMREAFKDVPPEEIEREADRSVREARERRRRQVSDVAARSA